MCVQAWAETIRVFFRNLGVTATHQGRSRTPLTVHVNITKSFRRRKRDECRHKVKDACPLRGSSERGQKDLPKLARLVRTQTQSIVQDPLSCHRIVRRACRHGMGAHTGRNERCKWAHTACQQASPGRSTSLRARVRAAVGVAQATACLSPNAHHRCQLSGTIASTTRKVWRASGAACIRNGLSKSGAAEAKQQRSRCRTTAALLHPLPSCLHEIM